MSYIRNLDGLRALAVVGVVAFHLSETHLPGGFIGVDVFFVISGFIITRGLRASGDRVGFADFYARRMARLLPAATVTIIVTLLVSAAILAPEDREQIAATALAALAFASNIFFRFNAGYFDDALAANPLLHFWSLSVEEQFYLVWPLLIVGLARLGPARAARWIAGLTLGAIVLSWSVERHDSTLFFYAMPMRAFQFLLGACLVYFEARPVRPMLQELIFASGMALVLIPFFVADGDDYSFVVAALLPALGTMAMIHSIDSKSAGWLLGSGPVRALGRSAYSIYLVHWPIVVFYRLSFGAVDSLGEMALLASASLGCGWALRLGVENRLRLRSDDPQKRAKLWGVALLVLAASSLSVATWLVPFRDDPTGLSPLGRGRSPAEASDPSRSLVAYAYDPEALRRERRLLRAIAERCQLLERAPLSSLDLEHCLSGEILLIGDSWVPGTLAALDSVIEGSRVATLGGAACGYIVPSAVKGRYQGCHDLVALRARAMLDDRYEAIVLAVNWSAWPERDLRPAFDVLRATGKQIVIMSDRPFFEAKVPTLLGARAAEAPESHVDLTPYLDPKSERAAAALRRTMVDYAEFTFVDQRSVLCPAGCPAFTPDGALIYLDRGHLTAAGARYVGESMREELIRTLR